MVGRSRYLYPATLNKVYDVGRQADGLQMSNVGVSGAAPQPGTYLKYLGELRVAPNSAKPSSWGSSWPVLRAKREFQKVLEAGKLRRGEQIST